MEKSKFTPTIVSKLLTKLFVSVVIVIGLFVLIGWFSGLMFLTRFSINEVPMAPSTAYVFIYLAAGLWFYLRPQKSAINRNIAIASVVIAISLSCLFIITNILNYYAGWEHAFITIPETQLSMKLGHMSLVTAVLFIISGFALLFLRSNRKIIKTFSIILTLIISIISFILLLGYAFGAPFFYFDSFIPPAALTVLSFLLVSIGLIAASDKNTFLIKTIWKKSTSAKLLRVFLPTTIAITIIESLIVIRILPFFEIHPAIVVSLVSLIVVVIVIVVISILSKSMGKTLDSALENLNESEANFRNVFENSPIGKSMTGIDGSLQVNKSFCKIVGYTEEELKAKSWMDISHPDEIQQTTELIQSLLNGTVSQTRFEKRYIHKDGSIVFTDVSTYLQRGTNGDPKFFITSVSDITERKQAEFELIATKEKAERSEREMERAQELAHIGSWNLDFATNEVNWSKELYKMYGFDPALPPPLLTDSQKLFTQESWELLSNSIAKTGKTGTPYNIELKTIRKDGSNGWMWAQGEAIRDKNEEITGLWGAAQDISESKEIAEELFIAKEKAEESNEKYLNLMDSLGTGVVLHAPDTSIILSNPKACEILGISPEQMQGKKAIDPQWRFVKNDGTDLPLEEYPVNKALSLMKSFSDHFIGIKRPDRKYITWVNVNASLVFDENNNIKYVTISFNDTTEQKQAEQSLKESEEKFKKIFKLSPVVMTLTDIETGVYLDVNEIFSSKLGFTRDEVIGTKSTDLDLFISPSAREDIIRLFNEQGFILNHEFQLRRKSGGIFHSIFSSYIIELKNKKVMLTTAVDITDRKQVEIALKESEEQLRIIADNLPVLISQIDKNLKYTFANKYYYDISLNQDKIIGESVVDIIGKETFNRAYPQMRKALSGELVSFENSHRNKNNKLLILETHYIPFFVNDQVESFFVLAMDITERKLAEEKIRTVQENLKNTFDISPSIISTVNVETGYFVDVSQAVTSILGYSVKEITSKPLMEFIHPDDRQRTADLILELIEGNKATFFENRYFCKDGSIKWLAWNATIADKNSIVTAIANDITERKLAEEALRESEAKLNALFTSLTEMVVMHEVVLNDTGEAIDYRIIDCNKVFTEVTGISEENAIGSLASELYKSDPPPYMEEFTKVGMGGDSYEFTTYYQPLDKHLMISVVSPQAGKFATITTDISEMMQIQEKIVAKNKEMENYLYVASHDLRTPLVNIQGFSLRLKKQADSIKSLFADSTLEPEILHQLNNIADEDIPKTLSFVLGNIEKMDTLINGLLQLSRTGRIDMNIQEIDMNELFSKILQSLDFHIKEAKCKIHIVPLPACYGDAALLDQLFANIISNALKYSDSKRALEITVNAKKTYNKVVYSIRDTGKGIAQKHLDKIWDVFYRIDPRSDKTGEGIGLSLVKRIAEKHKGRVWVESEEGKGSVFHIELNKNTFTEFSEIKGGK